MRPFELTRRGVMPVLGAGLAAPLVAGAAPPTPARLSLQARVGAPPFDPGQPPGPSPIFELVAPDVAGGVRLGRGSRCAVSFRNELPVPALLVWHGLDGTAGATTLPDLRPVPAGATETLELSVPQAGTLMADLRLLAGSPNVTVRPLPIIVPETESPAVDRDEIVLVEDWREATGAPAKAAAFTVNGKVSPDLILRINERLRLRLINGCQRTVVALKIDNLEVVVMALDGQPAEPFTARNGAVVLAPGSRADVFLDGTGAAGSVAPILLHDGQEARQIARLVTPAEPPLRRERLAPAPALPANGLPANIGLKTALRFDVALGAQMDGWSPQPSLALSSQPAFRARTGRAVVLAVRNSGPTTATFHMFGHHFRLLDRLDDGWKPYWLDTIALEPAQTQRIAFVATASGRWLLESTVGDWTVPRRAHWYVVE